MTTQQAIDLVSYKVGYKLGEKALEDTILNKDRIQKAIHDKVADTAEDIDMKSYMQATKIVKEERTNRFKKSQYNFLEENAKRPEITTTTSGLQYEVIENSTGEKPSLTSEVDVHYEGKLTDGTVFDSSIARGKPASFPLNKVIAGWKEGLQLMPKNSKFRFYIPENIGYGDRGAGSDIPPFASLIFEVELLDVY